MRHFFLIAALLVTAACSSLPPVTIETEHGTVRADSRADAEHVADALALAPQVRAALHATRTDLPEVWVVDRDLGAARGVCYEHRIELTRAGASERYHVTHELVHWYVVGSPFDGMPHFVEEGLADYVALDLLGLVDGRMQEQRALGKLSISTAALDVDERAWFELPDADKVTLTRIGFEIVSRVGLDRLQELAERGGGPWSYLDAARMEPR